MLLAPIPITMLHDRSWTEWKQPAWPGRTNCDFHWNSVRYRYWRSSGSRPPKWIQSRDGRGLTEQVGLYTPIRTEEERGSRRHVVGLRCSLTHAAIALPKDYLTGQAVGRHGPKRSQSKEPSCALETGTPYQCIEPNTSWNNANSRMGEGARGKRADHIVRPTKAINMRTV